MCIAQRIMRVCVFPILCSFVLILSKGILAYLSLCQHASASQLGWKYTHTVRTPLPAPATKVAVVPPIFSGQAIFNLSLISLNVANLTAESVPCLHNTGVNPFHKLNTPSLFTTSETILGSGCLPKLPPEEASWMTLVFRLSPGVTTNTLSVTPAHRTAATLMDVLFLPDTRVRYRFNVSKEKKRTPDLPQRHHQRCRHTTARCMSYSIDFLEMIDPVETEIDSACYIRPPPEYPMPCSAHHPD